MTEDRSIIAKSPVTGEWYRVTRWEDVGDGKVRALEKETIDESEVPEPVRERLSEGESGDEDGSESSSDYKINKVLK